MSDQDDQFDLAAVRALALERFKADAAGYFAANPDMHSLVFAVSQYFSDEAYDAVHESVIAFPSRDPWWPHVCGDDDDGVGASDGSSCRNCGPYEATHRPPHGHLESNSDAVYAWSAFCSEHGGGEGEPELQDPVAIARRGADGGVELEWVARVVRPWLDTNEVVSRRDGRGWGGVPVKARPEPTRAPWAEAEQPLFEAVLAAPLDDGPRRVLVDHWLERADERGEFGALSFGSPATEALRARRDVLAARHGRAWLGPLQPFISVASAQFARGPFVSRAVVSFRSDAEQAEAAAVADWALLDAIHFFDARQSFNTHMRGLREVTGVFAHGLASLVECGLRPPLHAVGLVEPVTRGDWLAAPLGAVRRLLIDCEEPRRFQELPVFSTLEQLEVWFTTPTDEATGFVQPWSDERGLMAFDLFLPLMRPGASVSVGYALPNGAHAGVVTTVTVGGGVRVERRMFTSERAVKNAQSRLAALGAPRPASVEQSPPQPLPLPGPAAPAPPVPAVGVSSALRRWLEKRGWAKPRNDSGTRTECAGAAGCHFSKARIRL